MRDRVQATRPETRVINRAAQVARNRMVGATASSGGAPAPGRDVTSAGGSDGDIYTKHPLIWGVDDWGDPASRWSEP